jgi:glutamate-5-semialdehyde dehydrogenase
VDADADLEMALAILLNAKTSRPSVCNAAESLLVHADVADAFLAVALPALGAAGVTVHGSPEVIAVAEAGGPPVPPATDEDYGREYLSLDLSARVVDSLDEAIAHIRRFGSGHSETIVTRSLSSAREFTSAIDAAVVLVNASSRFVDGGEFGYGAEIGISTQKLHARGPMGLTELTSTKYVVTGNGQTR